LDIYVTLPNLSTKNHITPKQQINHDEWRLLIAGLSPANISGH
jgi:hypothetical protein